MNPSDPQHPWNRLATAARRAPDDRDTAAPYGFATRVAALALAQERAVVSLLERFSLRALGLACLLAVASVAANYSALATALNDEDVALADEPVANLVDTSS